MEVTAQRWVRISAALFAAFLLLTTLVVAGWTQPLDDAWRSLMADGEVPWLISVAEAFDHVGGFPLALATTLVVGVVFAAMKKWWALGAWAAIVAGAQIFSTLTKVLVDRPRPVDALLLEPSPAYPSGHAMVSGAAMGIGLAVIVSFLWPRRHRLFLVAGVLYAVAMALSRTYLRVHWLTDVVGGLLFGTAIVCAVAAVVERRRYGDGTDSSLTDG